MLSLCHLTFTLLCSLSLVFSVPALQCNEKQYLWPLKAPKYCCDMCTQGKFMVRRSETSCEITCNPCKDDQYAHTFNTEMACKFCKKCNGDNMLVKSNCSAVQNTVCTCKAGYKCKDGDCTQCVLIPTTARPTTRSTTRPTTRLTLRPSTAALTTPEFATPQIKDTVWFLVIIALLCAGIALVIATKVKPFLRWIRSNHGYFLAEKPVPQTEDEDVSKPVQEVCGKCDQLIELCIKD
ncbi:tumor necrosis factor receptor superfamily member 5 isoform X2 [Mugil cephalus]|nr:tumor necrosis factor receptor superfamily member 5 isoform X2 [Mugil cephalus]